MEMTYMGDPPKLRNKFARPKRLWDKDRIEQEKVLKKEFGLKCMRELWSISGELKKYRREARRLLSMSEEERKADAQKILNKLARLGVLQKGAVIEDVLGLSVKDILERRLQTIVMRKGLARTMRQSRQLITHGFICVEGRRVQTPGMIIDTIMEPTLAYTKKIDISVNEPVEEVAEASEEEKSEE
jgi:small subunit ribosomal protein S4